MIVRAASRIERAISLGVRCRLAPSTMAIIRSRNVSPASAETLTTSQSERTRVPAVTALRSPPDSRITGALSPVITLSSTDAIPSITSPSHGMMSPASTRTASRLCSICAGIGAHPAPCRGSAMNFATSCLRDRRSASACAFPRPSAIASAKLANRTVNHSHAETARMNPAGASPLPISAWMKRQVVRTLTTSVTNITGFLTWWRGSSFLNESRIARRTIAASNSLRAWTLLGIYLLLSALPPASGGARRSARAPEPERTSAPPPAGSCL